jgi:hypothetical protein
MIQTWNLAGSAPRCCRCGAEFQEGHTFFSALTEQNGELARDDYCPGCWEEYEEEERFCFWRSRRLPEGRPQRIDTEVVLDLFDRLQQDPPPDRRELLFVLALYLTRRKALKLTGVRREGERELLEFRRPRRQETFLIENPRLSEDQIDAATERLKELLRDER